MIDVGETMRAMKGLWTRELEETGRAPQPRGFFEMHPETYYALVTGVATLGLACANIFPGGELVVDGLPVRRNQTLRRGLVRLVVAARETETVEAAEAFDDERGRRR